MEIINQYYKNRTAYKIGGARLRHILLLLPEESQTILDIGCGAGDLAKVLREKGHVVDGIDISPDAIAEAKPYLRNGFVADISSGSFAATLVGQTYDMVVFSEVLEHLFTPEDALKQVLPFLRDGGRVIVTVPNFLFWKTRLQILFGKFHYDKAGGLLDYGHIRFFTYAYALEVFETTNVRVVKENHFFPNLYNRGFVWLGNKFPSFFAYQFIFLLSRKEK